MEVLGKLFSAQLDLLRNERIPGGRKFYVIKKHSPDMFVMIISVEKNKIKMGVDMENYLRTSVSKKTDIHMVHVTGI